jgi:hypothetical protein
MKRIDKKYLEDLDFHSSEGKAVVGENGRKSMVYTPTVRPLLPSDVLDWKETGVSIILVTADGRKHIVPKMTGTPPDTAA